ncbi:hypothetical protein CLOM_g13478 [Closterium sp. NIES-68]|nr:hypothetical protein CLOM_g13478 [Closterium sp. NIES-68]GJP59717.1 hypothetical protein CLOP_g15093 [Closterium sp. NIES-67]
MAPRSTSSRALSLVLFGVALVLLAGSHAASAGKVERPPFVPGQILRKCGWSSLGDYTSSFLVHTNVHLHWRVVDSDTVKFAFHVTKGFETGKGWFGVGFSTNGKMNGDAIIAETMRAGTPKLLTLAGHTSVVDASGWTPTGLKITKNQLGTTIEFTRTTSDGGEVVLKPKGNNYITWAFGSTSWSANNRHSNSGHAVVDLSCNGCTGVFRKALCKVF